MGIKDRLRALEEACRPEALEELVAPSVAQTWDEWVERRDIKPNWAPGARGFIDGPPECRSFDEWTARNKARGLV